MLNPDNISPLRPNRGNVSNDQQSKTKPHGIPKSDKNFKKILTRVDGDHDGHVEEEEATAEDVPSPFDLAKKPVKKVLPPNPSGFTKKEKGMEEMEGELAALAASEDGNSELSRASLKKIRNDLPFLPAEDSDIAEEILDAETQEGVTSQENLQESNQAGLIQSNALKDQLTALDRQATSTRSDQLMETEIALRSKNQKLKNSGLSSSNKEKVDFAQENRGDLSYINPILQETATNEDSIAEQDISHSRTVQDIVDQIVKSIQVIESRGKTDTVVTLQHPPILQGAQVVLTSYESAVKEFNIAFTNLSAQAKQLLDHRLTQDSLTLALENKGFVVHMITTTTLAEVPLTGGEQQNFSRDQGREKGQQQQQRSKQESEEQA